jgi:spore germination protein YaaH
LHAGPQDIVAPVFATAAREANQPARLFATKLYHSHVSNVLSFQDIHESDRVVAVQTFVVPPDDEVLFQDAVTRTAEVSSTLKAEQV